MRKRTLFFTSSTHSGVKFTAPFPRYCTSLNHVNDCKFFQICKYVLSLSWSLKILHYAHFRYSSQSVLFLWTGSHNGFPEVKNFYIMTINLSTLMFPALRMGSNRKPQSAADHFMKRYNDCYYSKSADNKSVCHGMLVTADVLWLSKRQQSNTATSVPVITTPAIVQACAAC